MGEGKKRRRALLPSEEAQTKCVRCIMTRIESRIDQAIDAYTPLRPYIGNASGIEGEVRLREAGFWFGEFIAAADQQGVQHSCILRPPDDEDD